VIKCIVFEQLNGDVKVQGDKVNLACYLTALLPDAALIHVDFVNVREALPTRKQPDRCCCA